MENRNDGREEDGAGCIVYTPYFRRFLQNTVGIYENRGRRRDRTKR